MLQRPFGRVGITAGRSRAALPRPVVHPAAAAFHWRLPSPGSFTLGRPNSFADLHSARSRMEGRFAARLDSAPSARCGFPQGARGVGELPLVVVRPRPRPGRHLTWYVVVSRLSSHVVRRRLAPAVARETVVCTSDRPGAARCHLPQDRQATGRKQLLRDQLLTEENRAKGSLAHQPSAPALRELAMRLGRRSD